MSDTAKVCCADCVSFSFERRDEAGVAQGRCRFRPEMGTIAETLAHCYLFQPRAEVKDRVMPLLTRERAPRAFNMARPPSRSAGEAPARYRRTLRHPVTGDTEGEITMDRDGLKQVLRELLEEETMYGYPELGRRWDGGSVLLKPGDPEVQSKELPIDTFFHKIVMIRDKLRVLEAKLNGHDKLSEADKVELQGYISRCYGSLTTFNVLFANKDDHFTSK